jgi:Putative transposase/Transposase zinc-binding domain
MALGVIDVLRRFLPQLPAGLTARDEARRRAVWAISHCRTAALGGHLHACTGCASHHFAYHSCNHRACPQCGRAATAEWVERQLDRRLRVPYFLVTFTLPQELRGLFFGSDAKQAFDLLFAASSRALGEALASSKGPAATSHGFTGVLHTWNQRLHFHPHIHYLVPGGGLDADGHFVRVKNANFLAPLPPLRARFRHHFRSGLSELGWQTDPSVWTKDWGVHIQPCGDGASAVKYLGAYVSKTALGDQRLVAMTEETVTFRWKDRANGNRERLETLSGIEFCARYLRHVLPRGLRSIRYFGLCHPAARAARERAAFLSGGTLMLSTSPPTTPVPESASWPLCPCCHQVMRPVLKLQPALPRGPPVIS